MKKNEQKQDEDKRTKKSIFKGEIGLSGYSLAIHYNTRPTKMSTICNQSIQSVLERTKHCQHWIIKVMMPYCICNVRTFFFVLFCSVSKSLACFSIPWSWKKCQRMFCMLEAHGCSVMRLCVCIDIVIRFPNWIWTLFCIDHKICAEWYENYGNM